MLCSFLLLFWTRAFHLLVRSSLCYTQHLQLLGFVSNGVCGTGACDQMKYSLGRRAGQRSTVWWWFLHKFMHLVLQVSKQCVKSVKWRPCFWWDCASFRVENWFLTNNLGFFKIALCHLIFALFALDNEMLVFFLFLSLLQNFRFMRLLKDVILRANTVLD